MRKDDVVDLLVLKKKQYGKLNEAFDLTKQLAEAVGRQDQVSVQLIIGMRQEPINDLEQIQESLHEKYITLDEQGRASYAAFQDGAETQDQFAKMLVEQIAINRRMLDQLIALDKRVNMQLGGKDSYYAQGETPATR